ncbi:MAG TPA: transposase [Planctomycetota bacterium]|nr:transposase [Planctomycetota bacterium]
MSPPAQTRPRREIFDIEGHAYFVSFTCYRRLSLLGRDRCKRIVLGTLDTLSWRHQVGVVGYCVMPNHVHALLRPTQAGLLSTFMQQWKRLTSTAIQEFLHLGQPDDYSPFSKHVRDSAGIVHVWQARYYPFNVYTARKALKKLEYMHNNPVKAGLVSDPCDWPWSSAAYFLKGRPSPVRLVPMDGPIVFGTLSPRAKPTLKR